MLATLARVGGLALVGSVLLLLGSCGGKEAESFPRQVVDPEKDHGPLPRNFRNTSLRGRAYQPKVKGNSREAFEQAAGQGVTYVEVDFRLNAEGILVTAHDDAMEGDCGSVSQSTLQQLEQCSLSKGRHVGTLGQLLAQPFLEIYVDLKDTGDEDARRAERALMAALVEVERAGRARDVVLLLYRVEERWSELLQARGVRAGLKGYPKGKAACEAMVRAAARHGLELVSLELKDTTREILRLSAELGVWQLAWYTGPPDPDRWRAAAEAGLGGLKSGYWPLVETDVVAHWRPQQEVYLR